jgi:arsenate reductase
VISITAPRDPERIITMPSGKPKVLFLCTGNSARSQMAEGYLRHVAGDKFEPLSAGIEPKGLNPLAAEAMQEIGIDISKQKAKDVVSFPGQYIPYIVTVCDNAKERCPIFPRTFKFLHWSFEDPAAATGTREEKLAVFRRVRDEIGRRIEEEFVSASIAQQSGR